MRWISIGAALWLGSTAASALPIVAVDMDPSTTSIIEAERTIAPGATFTVDVVYDAMGEVSVVNGFEFDLAYDPTRLTVLALRLGNFLSRPVFQVEATLGPPEVGAAFVTIGSAGAAGSGVLASIDFIAPLTGFASIGLNDLLVAAPFGVEIPLDGVSGGTVVVPEPTAATLIGLGLLALAARRGACG